jgi:hypothetical protein
VSKDRLDVMLLPEEECASVSNDAAGWIKLVEQLRGFSIGAIGLEASGGYERGVTPKDGKAEIRKVRVTRDLGTRVEVDTGVKWGDQVILNPPVNLADGSKVQPRPDVAASDR